MANTIFNQILSAVNNVSSSTASGTVALIQSIIGSRMVSAITDDLSALQQVYGTDQEAVNKCVDNVVTTKGFPVRLVPLAEHLKTPGLSPLEVQQTIVAIESGAAAG